MSDPEYPQFDCLGCGVNTLNENDDYYMLRDELWAQVNPAIEGMLCFKCVEERLGRKLVDGDFNDAPVNDVWHRNFRVHGCLKPEASEDDFDDMTEMFEEMRRESQEKRARNRESSKAILIQRGIKVRAFTDAHLRVADRFDFWPGTGKYKNIKTGKYGRGVFNLIKEL